MHHHIKWILTLGVLFLARLPWTAGAMILKGNILETQAQFQTGQSITFLGHLFNPDPRGLEPPTCQVWVELADGAQKILKKLPPIQPPEPITAGSLTTLKIKVGLPRGLIGLYQYRLGFQVNGEEKISSPFKKLEIVPARGALKLISARPTLNEAATGVGGSMKVHLSNGFPQTLNPRDITVWMEFHREGSKLSESIRAFNQKSVDGGKSLELRIPFNLNDSETDKINARILALFPGSGPEGAVLSDNPLTRNGRSASVEGEVKDALASLEDYELLLNEGTPTKKSKLYSDKLSMVAEEALVEEALASARGGSASPKNLPAGFYTIDTPEEAIVVYQVKKGDTLKSISKKYFGKVDKSGYIANLNFLTTKKSIKQGDEIIVEVIPKRAKNTSPKKEKTVAGAKNVGNNSATNKKKNSTKKKPGA